MPTYYIVGEEDALGCTSTPPRIISHEPKKRYMLWPASSHIGRHTFGIVRGHAEEYRLRDGTNTRVYARELPEDAVSELLRHDEAVRAAEEALQAARAERRAFLAAQVPRSKLAKAPAEEIDRAK